MNRNNIWLMGFYLGMVFAKTIDLIFDFSVDKLIGNLFFNGVILILILIIKVSQIENTN